MKRDGWAGWEKWFSSRGRSHSSPSQRFRDDGCRCRVPARTPCLPASPLGSSRLLHLWGSRGTRVLGLDLSGPSCSLGLVQEPPGQVATPETHVSNLEAPPRSQEGPKGQLLMALVAIPGLGRVFGGPTRREDRSTRDRAERGHQPLPVCLQDFRLLELVLKAGARC